MPRAQFRDTIQLRWPNGALGVPPSAGSATVMLYDVGTSSPIADTVYADSTSATTLPNPVPMSSDGVVNFWLAGERELDVVVTCPGYTVLRTTVTTGGARAASGGLPVGGTTGQSLTKHSATSYDVIWTTPRTQQLISTYAQLVSWTLPATNVWTETPIAITVTFSGALLRVEFNVPLRCATKGQYLGWGIMADGAPPAQPLGALNAPENNFDMMAVGIYYYTPVPGSHRIALGLYGPNGSQIPNSLPSTLFITEQY